MSEINVGVFSESLNDKADRDLINTSHNTDTVLAYQEPTAQNNYTWYRIYKSGWVEQGGSDVVSSGTTTVYLPIAMENLRYTATSSIIYSGTSGGTVGAQINKASTTKIIIGARWNGAFNDGLDVDWQVAGKGDPNEVRNAIIDAMIEAGSSISYDISNLTDYVIGYQEPTSQNNYTWYRVWNSGWVEQGGTTTLDGHTSVVNLPITMANVNYNTTTNPVTNVDAWPIAWEQSLYRTTSSITLDGTGNNSASYRAIKIDWELRGQGDPTVIANMIENSLIHNSVNTYIVEKQLPTAQNNYTWYRKYSDGWVEQGGRVQLNGTISATNKRVNFPVEMATSKYIASVDNNANAGAVAYVGWESTTGMSVGLASGSSTGETTWEVKGMAA